MAAPLPNLDQRLREQVCPDRSPVMFQRWSELAFAHWAVEPAEVQATLPRGLQVDTFDDKAWIGLVPFFMQRIRPRFLPPVPKLSWFLELNVRTYVFDPKTGRPGVWFYSLDCNQSLAVAIARRFFHLPYFRASMQAEMTQAEVIYQCQRQGTEVPHQLRYRRTAPKDCAIATPGSLEFFLLERYLLYSSRPDGALFVGQVNHAPYQFAQTTIDHPHHPALAQAGFLQSGAPDSAIYSPGVDVSIFPLDRLRPAD